MGETIRDTDRSDCWISGVGRVIDKRRNHSLQEAIYSLENPCVELLGSTMIPSMDDPLGLSRCMKGSHRYRRRQRDDNAELAVPHVGH